MIPSAFAESRTLVTTDCSETVDILVYSDDDHLIYASVPKEYAQTYQKQMDSDPTFADKEIAEALSVLNPTTRALPEGLIEYQSYMYRNDLENAINAVAGQGSFISLLNTFGGIATSGFIQEMLKIGKVSTCAALAATLLGAAIRDAQQERESWWVQAYIDIVNGVIRSVRYTIVQNMKSEYPKAWRVFERIA